MKKIFTVLATLILASSYASATTITCLGDAKELQTTVVGQASGVETVDFSFVDAGAVQHGQVDVEVNIMPKGTYLKDNVVRVYKAFYKSESLKFSFWISQILDSHGQVVQQPRNAFSIEAEVVGACTVQ